MEGMPAKKKEERPEENHLNSLISQGAHLDQRTDPTVELVAEHGIEGALDQLQEAVLTNPNDSEALRMLKLIQNRAADLLAQAEKNRRGSTH